MTNQSIHTEIGNAYISIALLAELIHSAEGELTAFYVAVCRLHGITHAELAADDWIREVETAEWNCSDQIPEWRRFTIKAAAKLAERISQTTCNLVVAEDTQYTEASRPVSG
jgi:hypothetical protein